MVYLKGNNWYLLNSRINTRKILSRAGMLRVSSYIQLLQTPLFFHTSKTDKALALSVCVGFCVSEQSLLQNNFKQQSWGELRRKWQDNLTGNSKLMWLIWIEQRRLLEKPWISLGNCFQNEVDFVLLEFPAHQQEYISEKQIVLKNLNVFLKKVSDGGGVCWLWWWNCIEI